MIHAHIRAGRPMEVRHSIMSRLADFYSELTGTDPKEILVVVEDVPAQWGMEAGMIMPEPTHQAEAAWFASLKGNQDSQRALRAPDVRRRRQPPGWLTQ